MVARIKECWRTKGTRIIAVAAGIVAAVASVPDVIPPTHLKYALAFTAAVTYLRGQSNANAEKRGEVR